MLGRVKDGHKNLIPGAWDTDGSKGKQQERGKMKPVLREDDWLNFRHIEWEQIL